ncbi:MAG: hypothetical protein ACOY3I_01975 [Verrucomicrobiota bacterium]
MNILAISGVIFCVSSIGAVEPFVLPSEYEADIVVLSEDGTKYVTEKIFVTDLKTRKETHVKGEKLVTIIRRDMNAVYKLQPSARMYTTTAISSRMPFEEDLRKEADWTLADARDLNGRTIERWEGIARHGRETVKMVYWIDRGTRFPIRRNFNGQIVNIMNIRPAKQNPMLFEIPKDFIKTNTP